jgi:hypothetical protein
MFSQCTLARRAEERLGGEVDMPATRGFSFRVGWAAVMACLAVLGLAAPAAARPLSGSGTATITRIGIEVVREAGGNVTQVRTVEATVSGAIQGTFVQEVTGVVHKSGLVTFQGTMTFSGSVADCGEGTFMVGVTGRAQSGLPTAEATFRTINQAAATLAITGTGTLQQTGLEVTYDVRYTCR